MKEKKHDGTKAQTSRRRFTKSVAAALAAAPAAFSAAGAQERPAAAPAESKPPPAPHQPTPSTPATQQAPPSPVAEAYAALARARFGEHIPAEEFERVKRDLESNVRAADRLRAAKLNNSDEPDFIFGA